MRLYAFWIWWELSKRKTKCRPQWLQRLINSYSLGMCELLCIYTSWLWGWKQLPQIFRPTSDWWFSKCSPWTSSTSNVGNLLEMETGLTRAHRDWSSNHGTCMGLQWALCIYVIVVNVFVGFLIPGARVVSDSFACSWDLFPPAGLPLPALMWDFMPSLVQSFYAVFGWYLWEDCSFLKGKEEQWRGEVGGWEE